MLFVILFAMWHSMPASNYGKDYVDDCLMLGLLVSSYLLAAVPRVCKWCKWKPGQTQPCYFPDTGNEFDWSGEELTRTCVYLTFFFVANITGFMRQNQLFDNWLQRRQTCSYDDWCTFFMYQPLLRCIYHSIYSNVVSYAFIVSAVFFSFWDTELAKVETPADLVVWLDHFMRPILAILRDAREDRLNRAKEHVNVMVDETMQHMHTGTGIVSKFGSGVLFFGSTLFTGYLEYIHNWRMLELFGHVIVFGLFVNTMAKWWFLPSEKQGEAAKRQATWFMKLTTVGFMLVTLRKAPYITVVGLVCLCCVPPWVPLPRKHEVRMITCLAVWFWALFLHWFVNEKIARQSWWQWIMSMLN